MVAMGLLSRRSGSLVLCGRTEAANTEDFHDRLVDKLARRGRQGEVALQVRRPGKNSSN